MATKIVIRDGVAHGVYDDRLRPIFEALGQMRVERASNVEFDASSGDWVATLPDGKEISRGKNRAAVIAEEIKYLEARL